MSYWNDVGYVAKKWRPFAKGIREFVLKNPGTEKDYFRVYSYPFGPSSLDILLYVFVEVSDGTAELRERERLFLGIMPLGRQLGVRFAFPTQAVDIESHAQQMPPTRVPGDR